MINNSVIAARKFQGWDKIDNRAVAFKTWQRYVIKESIKCKQEDVILKSVNIKLDLIKLDIYTTRNQFVESTWCQFF